MIENSNPVLRVAASPAMLKRGCVNIIELDEIKSEVGLRWEKLKASVWARLEILLRQKLSPTDYFIQIDDTKFLVTLPSATAEEAQIFCLRTAHELHSSLLGGCEIQKLRISSATASETEAFGTRAIAGAELIILARQASLDNSSSATVTARLLKGGPSEMSAQHFTHRYVPVWNAQQEAVTTYRCVSMSEQSLLEAGNPSMAAKLALGMTISRMNTATATLGRHLAIGERFLMWVPIAYEVLSAPVGRMEIAGVCRNLSADLRPYLIFEVSDLPYGVPQSRLSDLVGSLRPFCRGVVAQLPARIHNYGAYLGAGLQAIGLSFSSNGVSGTEMGSELFKLSIAAKKQRVKSFAFDLPQHDQLAMARELGINLLSSPLIGRPLDVPAPVKLLPMMNIPNQDAAHVVAA